MNKPPVLLIDDEISKAAFSLLLKKPFYAGGGGGARLMAVTWQTQVGDSPAPWRPRNRQYPRNPPPPSYLQG